VRILGSMATYIFNVASTRCCSFCDTFQLTLQSLDLCSIILTKISMTMTSLKEKSSYIPAVASCTVVAALVIFLSHEHCHL